MWCDRGIVSGQLPTRVLSKSHHNLIKSRPCGIMLQSHTLPNFIMEILTADFIIGTYIMGSDDDDGGD